IGTTTVTCTATDDSGNTASGSFTVTVSVATPTIDVTPSAVNLNNQGVITVTLLSTASFDALTVDLASLRFPAPLLSPSAESDVNGDGRMDLVLDFRTQDTNLQALYRQLLIDADTTINGVLDPGVSTSQRVSVSLTGTANDQYFSAADEVDIFLAGSALR